VILPALPGAPVRPVKAEAFVFRCRISTPVRTSFGTMHDRPAVFVRVEDADGAVGWGEVWCNFPSCGAEHRARLVETVAAPLLTSRAYASPAEAFASLTQRTAVLAIQSGEHGPLAQVIAGIDLALWDLCARRAGQPLWRYLRGTTDAIPVYASGINPDAPRDVVAARCAEGHRAFKLKVGFGETRDVENVASLRDFIGADRALMVDANQAWDVDEAERMARRLEDFDLRWLEEPLRADRPWCEWDRVARAAALPLAAGENLVGEAAFEEALTASPVSVIQPDLAKWGGLSACWPVIRRARELGIVYCPHFLGGGIGLMASAHVLAAAGGDGMLEIDANPNPLRTLLSPRLARPDEGRCVLGDAPGIGVEPDLALLAEAAAAGC
jgi:L-alanine-DL-glutamate epimerase-like enolase superfamily enzyme